jgi:E3 ubiquitin-protein ligase HERC1
LKFADLEGYDAYSFQVLRDIKKYGQELTAEAFEAAVDEKFETYLSNGKCVEICPGGSDLAVTHANHQEYVDLVIKARINECQKQIEWVKEGVNYIIPLQILDFLTWEEVELRAVGPKEIESSALKACSEYNVGEDHKMIKWFWTMFESFTQEERRKYLKFVWGRSKLPVETTTLEYKHQVHFYEDRAMDSFPESHTCFFTVDIGPYKSIESMTARFKTAIELCGEIDADHDAG